MTPVFHQGGWLLMYAGQITYGTVMGRPCHKDRHERGSSLPSTGFSFLLNCKEIGPAGFSQQSKAL